MNIEPCVRFAMRIRPKISEKPAESRNSRPPRARLFNVWMIQYCMVCRWKPNSPPLPVGKRRETGASRLLLEVLRRRPVARVDRVLQEFVGLVFPELADVRIGVNHGVHQATVLS